MKTPESFFRSRLSFTNLLFCRKPTHKASVHDWSATWSKPASRQAKIQKDWTATPISFVVTPTSGGRFLRPASNASGLGQNSSPRARRALEGVKTHAKRRENQPESSGTASG